MHFDFTLLFNHNKVGSAENRPNSSKWLQSLDLLHHYSPPRRRTRHSSYTHGSWRADSHCPLLILLTTACTLDWTFETRWTTSDNNNWDVCRSSDSTKTHQVSKVMLMKNYKCRAEKQQCFREGNLAFAAFSDCAKRNIFTLTVTDVTEMKDSQRLKTHPVAVHQSVSCSKLILDLDKHIVSRKQCLLSNLLSERGHEKFN